MTFDRFGYVEIASSHVSRLERERAEALVRDAARHLGMRPLRVRWLARADPDELEAAERAGGVALRRAHAISGLYRLEGAGEVWVVMGAPLETVAHEVMHAWQHAIAPHRLTERNVECLEAEALAFGRRFAAEWKREHRA